MAELDAKTEGTLRGFVREVRDLYGEDVLSVILYGSGVGQDYIPDVSDLNLLVVLREVGPEQLGKALKYVKRWCKKRINPLFLDPHYIESSLDAFPIEFLEMEERHRLLWGEDLLEGLEVPRENLRLQCEQELKGKWLKLRQAYLETEGNPKRVKGLLITSLRPFGVVLSALLRLKGFAVPPGEFLEVVTQVEEALGLELPSFHEVYQLKQGFRSPHRAELTALFSRYLTEVRRLAQAADALFLNFHNTIDQSVYAIKFDLELNRLSPPFDILEDLDRLSPGEGFPDNSFFYHDGFFYGVHQGFWTDETCSGEDRGYFSLHLAKYDREFRLVKSVVVGYYCGREGEPPKEAYDSPLVKVYGDRVYVINKLSGRRGTWRGQIGNVLRVYDMDLHLLRRLELPSPPGTLPISTGDFVPCGDDVCIVEASYEGTKEDELAGRVHPTLAVVRYDREGRFLGWEEPLPDLVLPRGDIRTLHRGSFYYVPFNFSDHWDAEDKKGDRLVETLGIAIFDEAFKLQSWTAIQPFQPEGHRRACAKPGQHIWIQGDSLYMDTEIRLEQGEGCFDGAEGLALQMFRFRH